MDIQSPSNKDKTDKTDKTKLYCINCGKKGHNSKKCLFPIISIGIICIKLKIKDIDLNQIINYSKKIQNNYLFSNDEIYKLKNILKKIQEISLLNNLEEYIEYLMIMRKNSLNYIEFMRGKIHLENIDYLEKSFNFMSTHEKDMLLNNDFEYLWNNLWNNNGNNSEYGDSKKKFDMLKKGFYGKKNDINIFINFDKLINNSILLFNSPEWGFPKGRRNLKEKNIECAQREFEVETGLLYDSYHILNMTPLEETYLSTNNLKYKHIYYIGQINDYENNICIDKSNITQSIEVGDIKWLKFNDALEIIRDYNIEKKYVLINKKQNHPSG